MTNFGMFNALKIKALLLMNCRLKILFSLLCFLWIGSAISQPNDLTASIDTVKWQQELIEKYELQLKTERRQRRRDSLAQQRLMEDIRLNGELKEEALILHVSEIETRDSAQNAARKAKIFGLKEKSIGYPVSPFGDTLFLVYLKIGPILPEERAASISEKIALLADNNSFDSDSLIVVQNESTFDIVYNALIVMSITDWDGLWFETEGLTLANQYKEKIADSITTEQKTKALSNILIKVGLVLGIVLIVFTVIVFLNRIFRRFVAWLRTKRETFFKGFHIRTYEVFTPERQLSVSLSVINLVRWLIIVLALYISLPVIFSIFPFTQGWATTLFAWIWNPAKNIALSAIKFLPNVFSIAVIFLATRYLVNFFRFLSKEIESSRLTLNGFYADWASPTFSIIKVLLYAFMFVAIFPYLPGSDSPIFKGVSVFLGVLFSLGSSSAIANAVSGLVITYMRPFQIGDRVKIGEVTGDVIEKTVLVTRIKTIKNEYITVPNASILAGHTINYSTSKENNEGLIAHTTVTIGYDVPWRKIHELLISAAQKTSDISDVTEPFVLQTSLDDNYVSYQLNAVTFAPEKLAKVYSELHKNIQDLFNDAKIEILSPHYRAVRDGNKITTIPKASK